MCPTLLSSWTVTHQAPLSMGFPRQEYWSGLPFPPAGDLPDPGRAAVSPVSLALAGGFFTTEQPRKPVVPLFLSRFFLICEIPWDVQFHVGEGKMKAGPPV